MSIEFLGEVLLDVDYNGNKFVHSFQIVSKNSISLLGRDICDKLRVEILFSDKIEVAKGNSVFISSI